VKKMLPAVFASLVLAAGVWAQQIVDQGAPGTQGAWPVSVSGITIVFDGGITIASGTVIVTTGPDGGAVQANITQSIALQVFMDGGQQITVNQGTSPWACYVAMDGGQHVIADQGTSPWVVSVPNAIQVFMDGGQRIVVDQGTNPWIIATDGGATSTYPVQCRSTALDAGAVEQNTVVGAAAVQVPASPSVGRVYVNICNSVQNASTAVVKCRQDGVAPVFAAGNPGQVLLFGDCLVSTASTTANTIQCIADAAGRNVTSYECVPQ